MSITFCEGWVSFKKIKTFCMLLQNIPVAFFSKHVEGRNEHKIAKLRSEASDTTWEVEIDGRRLTGGWKEFVTAHDLRIGDVVVFRHEGDLVFHITALGPSCCEIEYTLAHKIDDDSDVRKDTIASEIRPIKKRAKKNPRREDYSSSGQSCFVANVSLSSLRDDKLYIPVSFVRSNGLSKTYCKIVLLNEMGRSWNLSLNHDKSGTYIRHGWRRFCSANGINGGRFTFKLVRRSGTPVFRLYQAEYRHEVDVHSYFVGSLTPSSIRNDTLYLPRRFVNSNGLKKGCCEMILKNGNGGTWNLVLRHNKSSNATVLSGGWRSFCRANGIKARDPFRFKLVGTTGKPVLRLCLAESNRDTRQVDCSEGNHVNSLSTNPSSREESSETNESKEKSRDDISVKEEDEEESIKDKKSSRECLNTEKWKYCSKLGASSSPSQNRFVILTVTPYSVKSNKMRLPLRFTQVNGINKAGKITMLGKDGVKWMVHLTNENRRGRMRLGRDWKGFCEVHGVKIGESFVLELIWEEGASPVLKFCTKVNCV